MKKIRMTSRIKTFLINSRIPPSNMLDHVNALLKYGRWLRMNPSPVHFNHRERMYEYLNDLIGDTSYDYLEYGVFEGRSMKYWVNLSSNLSNRYFGFDTFTGLPEDWDQGIVVEKKGTFDVNGKLPELKDERITFIKGLFQDTLPSFMEHYVPQKRMVVHFDADLYSSELFLLTIMNPVLTHGTYLIFDNFSVATHDFRAFVDYTNAYKKKYKVIATADLRCGRIAIQLQ